MMNPIPSTTATLPSGDNAPIAAGGVAFAASHGSTASAKAEQSLPPPSEQSVIRDPLSAAEDAIEESSGGIQSMSVQGLDDRKSPRSAVPPTRQACELKLGKTTFSALLLNESDGGFAALVADAEGLKVGKKVTLCTESQSFALRVVYMRKVSPPRGASPADATWFRLGLKKASGSLFSFFS
jgi:hypothetical protein